jgi:hypothetical protein
MRLRRVHESSWSVDTAVHGLTGESASGKEGTVISVRHGSQKNTRDRGQCIEFDASHGNLLVAGSVCVFDGAKHESNAAEDVVTYCK